MSTVREVEAELDRSDPGWRDPSRLPTAAETWAKVARALADEDCQRAREAGDDQHCYGCYLALGADDNRVCLAYGCECDARHLRPGDRGDDPTECRACGDPHVEVIGDGLCADCLGFRFLRLH